MEVRAEHLRTAKLNEESGYVTKISGPLITPESLEPGATKKLVGSMLLVRGTSVEDVFAKVQTDVYWTNRVWDREKLVISPIIINADI